MTSHNFPKDCVENDVVKHDNLQENCNSQTVLIPLPKFAPFLNKPFYENFETLLSNSHSSNNKVNHNGNPNKDYSNMITLDSTYDQERPSEICLKEKSCETFKDITKTSENLDQLPTLGQLAVSIENNPIDPNQLSEILLSDPHSSNNKVNHNGNPNKDYSNTITLDSTYDQERPSEISLKEKWGESFEDITNTSELPNLGQLSDSIENNLSDPKQLSQTLLSNPHSSNIKFNYNGNPNNMITLDSTYNEERPPEISLKENSCETFEDITKTSENLDQLPSLGQLADSVEYNTIDPNQLSEILLSDPNSSNNEVNNNGNAIKDCINTINLDPTYDQNGSSKVSLNEKSGEIFGDITTTSEFPNLGQLAQNIEHKPINPNECAICGKILRNKYNLKMHYRIHKDALPFKCKHCDSKFQKQSLLTRHLNKRREKPAIGRTKQCPICNTLCCNYLHLKQHVKSHKKKPSLHLTQLCQPIYCKPLAFLSNKIRRSQEETTKKSEFQTFDLNKNLSQNCRISSSYSAHNMPSVCISKYNLTQELYPGCLDISENRPENLVEENINPFDSAIQIGTSDNDPAGIEKLDDTCSSVKNIADNIKKSFNIVHSNSYFNDKENENKNTPRISDKSFGTITPNDNAIIIRSAKDKALSIKLKSNYSQPFSFNNYTNLHNSLNVANFTNNSMSVSENKVKNTSNAITHPFTSDWELRQNAACGFGEINQIQPLDEAIKLSSDYHHPFSNKNGTNPHISLNVPNFTNYSMPVTENKVKGVISNAITHPFTADWELRQNAANGFREINQIQFLESDSQNISTMPAFEKDFDVTFDNRFIAEPESLISKRKSSELAMNIQTDPKQGRLNTAETFNSSRTRQLGCNMESNLIKLNQRIKCEKLLITRKTPVTDNYFCSACPRVYRNSAALKRHIQCHKKSHGEFKVTPPQTTHLCKSIDNSPSVPDNEIHRSHSETTKPAIQTFGLNKSLSQNPCISSLNSAYIPSSLRSETYNLSTELHPDILDISEPGQDNLVEENIHHSNSANSIGTIDNDSAIIENAEMMEALGLQVLEILNKKF